jgi:hypothetical protein
MSRDREPFYDFLLPMISLDVVILVHAEKTLLLRIEISITLNPRVRCYTVRFGDDPSRGRQAEQ